MTCVVVVSRQLDAHYRAMHQFQCNECSKIFLSARLLDIHISEMHDSFFKTMAERQPMYVCLIEGCPETFRCVEFCSWFEHMSGSNQHKRQRRNADARQRHLVCDHHYPKTYDFHHPFRSRDKKRDKAKHKARTKRQQATPCAVKSVTPLR